MIDECNHVFISNSGRGGKPQYRSIPMLSVELLMHVKCSECNARTWFTKTQWKDLIPAP